MHSPTSTHDLCLYFPGKPCFKGFNSQIHFGSRIAILGRNGSGKSAFLKMLLGEIESTRGDIFMPDDINIGYVPQTIDHFEALSGGQRLNKALTKALTQNPNLLLLDEPTNHLDTKNRKSLLSMLNHYYGTLIVVTHDLEVLRNCVDTLYHIDNNQIHVFSGCCDDYMNEINIKRDGIENELSCLKREKKMMHEKLMIEQKRAAKSREKGEKSIARKKWPTVVSRAKAMRGQKTSGKKKAAIDRKKYELSNELEALHRPEIILPKFQLISEQHENKTIVSISEGSCGYTQESLVLKDIHLLLNGSDRIGITGNNASGKSTLLKAIMSNRGITKTGHWHIPKPEQIGYLDQHYANLNPQSSVFEMLANARPDWSHAEIRKHLNDFLFRKNEEINRLVIQLSGGEKVRLSLSLIAALTPKLLILDEITNNIDLETKDHLVQVLNHYPGSMIVVSHEETFLEQIGIDVSYNIKDGNVTSPSILSL